jgi:hypothetical protein
MTTIKLSSRRDNIDVEVESIDVSIELELDDVLSEAECDDIAAAVHHNGTIEEVVQSLMSYDSDDVMRGMFSVMSDSTSSRTMFANGIVNSGIACDDVIQDILKQVDEPLEVLSLVVNKRSIDEVAHLAAARVDCDLLLVGDLMDAFAVCLKHKEKREWAWQSLLRHAPAEAIEGEAEYRRFVMIPMSAAPKTLESATEEELIARLEELGRKVLPKGTGAVVVTEDERAALANCARIVDGVTALIGRSGVSLLRSIDSAAEEGDASTVLSVVARIMAAQRTATIDPANEFTSPDTFVPDVPMTTPGAKEGNE